MHCSRLQTVLIHAGRQYCDTRGCCRAGPRCLEPAIVCDVYCPACRLTDCIPPSPETAGPAGRVANGVCYRLWSETTALQEATPPDILNADLAPLALQLAQWGCPDGRDLLWLDPPQQHSMEAAQQLLQGLGAVDGSGLVTSQGQHGLQKRTGRCIVGHPDWSSGAADGYWSPIKVSMLCSGAGCVTGCAGILLASEGCADGAEVGKRWTAAAGCCSRFVVGYLMWGADAQHCPVQTWQVRVLCMLAALPHPAG